MACECCDCDRCKRHIVNGNNSECDCVCCGGGE